MQALEIIHRQNEQAVRDAVPAEVAKGKFVVAKFSGLNFVGYESFDNERDRNAAAIAHTNAAPGNRTELHSPTN